MFFRGFYFVRAEDNPGGLGGRKQHGGTGREFPGGRETGNCPGKYHRNGYFFRHGTHNPPGAQHTHHPHPHHHPTPVLSNTPQNSPILPNTPQCLPELKTPISKIFFFYFLVFFFFFFFYIRSRRYDPHTGVSSSYEYSGVIVVLGSSGHQALTPSSQPHSNHPQASRIPLTRGHFDIILKAELER